MNITKFVPKSLTRAVGGQILTLKKNSPHIFFGVGITGVVSGSVLACRATLKAEPILDEMKEQIEGVKTHLSDTPGYSRDLAHVYGRGAVDLTKLYAPAAIVGGLGIACLTGSHVQLTRRNTALTIAYNALHYAFDEYRSRVRDEVGDERERDLYFNMETKTEKDGTKNVEVKELRDPSKVSPYARLFDEYSKNWQKDSEYNYAFVKAQEAWHNNILQHRGHVFLNEVYDSLGIERSTPGSVVGWTIGGGGDGYIDFGIYNPANARFVDGSERSIWLDFNVDGVIYDRIEQRRKGEE